MPPRKQDDPVDALYAAAPERFVAERDALAKALRADGDRAGAERVRALRKPTRAAAAVNAAVRGRPEAARALGEAAQRLQRAQEAVLAGGDAGALREADAAARAAVDELAAAGPAGDGPTADKVRATLRAATVDPDVLAEVLAGRLAREREASGFGGLAATLGEAKAAGTQQRAAAETERRRRREELDRARANEASAVEAVAAAGAALRDAEAALRDAETAVAARRSALEDAEQRLDEARLRRAQAEG